MPVTSEDINLVIEAIKTHTAYNFSNYSIKSFTRRIEKALIDFRLDIDKLILSIKKDSDFVEKLVKNITVNTTELFRDPKVWQTLRYRVLNNFSSNRKINIWHAGSSTGQEVYSMLILLNEMGLLEKANVFATDLNTDVLNKAKAGEYTYRFNLEYFENFNKVIRENPFNYEEFSDIPYEKYFYIDKSKDIIKVKEFLRKKPVWFKHDLVTEGNNFNTKFDLILCRNVLIYFNTELQNHVINTFYQSLFRKGALLIGVHESIIGSVANNFIKSGLVYMKKD
ncbi:MAG: CheR family methyltransferase [Bacteroidota bacterium]